MTVKTPYAGAERSPTKGKQRSIHMDDETFELLQTLAAKHKINNSSVVRMALAAFAASGGTVPYQEPPPAVKAQVAVAGGAHEEAARVTGVRDIALPDPRVSSFSVSGGKVRQRIPRNDREDDGLDV